MELETLYKTSAKGAILTFDIEVVADHYTVTWGQQNGKMQTKHTICTPKNVGRSNVTTAEEQAIVEAKAVWVKKQKANYSTSTEAPVLVNLPMKVNTYQAHKAKVIFPCFTSVKLNGVNAEYRLVEGNLQLLSRGGEQYPIPPHQREEVATLMNHLGLSSLNGEMYIHGEYLQDIMAATNKHNVLTPRLVFWIFDFPTAPGTYEERCSTYYTKAQELEHSSIQLVNVGVAYDHDDIEDMHDIATSDGYEGVIVRNPAGLYEYNKRSLDVFKYKVAQDAEFLVFEHKIDKNGHAVFNCMVNPELPISDENTFEVKLKGTNEERLAMAAIADTYIGKYLKVEYEMLSKDDKPQKPVGIMFREVDADGEAIE